MSEEPQVAERTSDLRDRTEIFGQRIVNLYRSLPRSNPGRTFADQVLRSGTSVGAQFAESCWSKSPADFVSKICGAMQELEETRYWLKLIAYAQIFDRERLQPLLSEITELLAIFNTMVRRTHANMNT